MLPILREVDLEIFCEFLLHIVRIGSFINWIQRILPSYSQLLSQHTVKKKKKGAYIYIYVCVSVCVCVIDYIRICDQLDRKRTLYSILIFELYLT